MNYFQIEVNKLITDQHFWPLSRQELTFYNLKKRESFTYYKNPNMINGILIDINPNTNVTNRTIYTTTTWLEEVGGFSGALWAIFLVISPFLKSWPLEKYLINNLFKINLSG